MWRHLRPPRWQFRPEHRHKERAQRDTTIDVNGTQDWICRCTRPDDLRKMIHHLEGQHPGATINPRPSMALESTKLSPPRP